MAATLRLVLRHDSSAAYLTGKPLGMGGATVVTLTFTISRKEVTHNCNARTLSG